MDSFYVIRMVAARQDGVVTAAQCREAGLTPDQVKTLCRDRRWQRINRGAYLVDADAEEAPARRALIRAAVLSAGPRAVAVLGAAAELHRIAGLRPDPVVHLSLPGVNARPRRLTESDVRLHQFTIDPNDVTLIDGIAVTTPARTLADLLLRVDRFTAVCLLDSALNRGILSADGVALIAALMAGRRGANRARPWLAEVDRRAESPLETRVRLRAVDGDVAPDELQYRVVDRSGRIVAIVDLAWLRSRVIGEADGAEAHDNPEAIFRDRTRQNDIVTAGFVPVRFTWADTLTPAQVPAAVRAAMYRAPAA